MSLFLRRFFSFRWRLVTAGLLSGATALYAQQREQYLDCVVQWNDSSLELSNSRISRNFLLKEGQLYTQSITNKKGGQVWPVSNTLPDESYPGVIARSATSTVQVLAQPVSNMTPAHLRVTVTTKYPGLAVLRVFRLYPNCPAIACDLYYRGTLNASWTTEANPPDDRHRKATGPLSFPVTERIRLTSQHWQFTNVQFTDATDVHNTLVQQSQILGYQVPVRLGGNVLFADDKTNGGGLFFLKESPAAAAQVAYAGFDFQVSASEVDVVGAGLRPDEMNPTEWLKGYGVVLGVYGPGDLEKLAALRIYQKQIRRHLPARDEMVMLNTWGDRNRDASIGEAFLLKELRAGAKLGITSLQIDDGWQQGLSLNSAFKASGRLWDQWDAASWQPNASRFPNGLAPVVDEARKLGIQLGLWFHPSNADSYARWQTDADIVIGLYRTFGIRTFKIDGIELPDKRAESNLRHFFDAVVSATNGEVVFNVDATAGQRMGYHFLNQYGNIFLENRYTDFGNYYPYQTLRNLWMLSRYIPAENLQIEFLNKWRNAGKYPQNDPFAPAHVPFDYTFAITMIGQPLAWFEASNLPPEAFGLASLIKAYQQIQVDVHKGIILPIGDEPSGSGWTGFQSIRDSVQRKDGYILVFRELNQETGKKLKLWLGAGRTVELTAVLGSGKSFRAVTDTNGRLSFRLPGPHSFALYKYSVQ